MPQNEFLKVTRVKNTKKLRNALFTSHKYRYIQVFDVQEIRTEKIRIFDSSIPQCTALYSEIGVRLVEIQN